MVDRANDVLTWAEEHLLRGTFGRDDYRELCELVVHYLGGRVLRPRLNAPPSFGFKMRAPGALHHARFLASAIYIMKLSMLSQSLPPDMINIVNVDGIQRMAQFISLFYMPYFLQARLSSEAPRLDLTLWRHMEVYEKHDTDIADEVKKSINCQLWYLTEECVVLSLFDDGVSDNEKIELCQRLLAIPRPATFSPRKPTFPVQILAQNPDNLSLSSFIGSRSWLIFHLLENNGT